MPAMLRTASTWPKCATAASNAARIDAGSVMSSGCTNNRSEGGPFQSSGLRRVATTFQPTAWNLSAAALPKPDEVPVMKTVLVM